MENRLIITTVNFAPNPVIVKDNGENVANPVPQRVQVSFNYHDQSQEQFFNGTIIIPTDKGFETTVADVREGVLEFLRGVK